MRFFGFGNGSQKYRHEDELPPTRRSWIRLSLSLHWAAMLISVLTFAGGIGHLVCGIMGLKDGGAVPYCAAVCVAAGVTYFLVSVTSIVTLKSRLGEKRAAILVSGSLLAMLPLIFMLVITILRGLAIHNRDAMAAINALCKAHDTTKSNRHDHGLSAKDLHILCVGNHIRDLKTSLYWSIACTLLHIVLAAIVAKWAKLRLAEMRMPNQGRKDLSMVKEDFGYETGRYS